MYCKNLFENLKTVNTVHRCPSSKISTSECVQLLWTRNSKVFWEEPRRHPSQQRITMPQSLHWLQSDAPRLFPKLPFLRWSRPIPRLTPLTNLNGIQSQSAILPQYTPFRQTIRQTDRQTRPTDGIYDKSVPLYYSDAANNIVGTGN